MPGTPEHKVYQQMLSDDYPSTLSNYRTSELMEFLQERPRAAIFGSPSFIPIVQDDIVTQPTPLAKTHIALAFQKDSELRDMFNFYITRLRASGVLVRVLQRWGAGGSDNEARSDGKAEVAAFSLGYNNLVFPFFLVFIGSAFAFVIFCIETISSKFGNAIMCFK